MIMMLSLMAFADTVFREPVSNTNRARMKRMKFRLFAILSLAVLLSTPVSAALQGKVPVAGVDYVVLPKPLKTTPGGKIAVVQTFSYACGHCNEFEPKLDAWRRKLPADVAFVYMPAPFGGFFDDMARAYYTARELGVVSDTHRGVYRAIHVDRTLTANDRSKIFATYASLGVDRERFESVYASKRIDQQLRRAKARIVLAGVEGVPAMIVAGKYRINAGENITHESMLATVDYLISIEREYRAGR